MHITGQFVSRPMLRKSNSWILVPFVVRMWEILSLWGCSCMFMSTEINLKCCFSDTVQHGFGGGYLIGLEFAGWAGLGGKQAPEIANTFPHSQFLKCGA